jgi:superfamily I DNA and/or RNA helicase
VLGGSTRRTGDKLWAAEKPNLLNVAVSRARRRLYVIGNHDVWSGHRYFETLADQLPATE